MSQSNEFCIGILNGGKSRRMGKPKSLVIYKGLTFFEHIYNISIKFSKNIYILGDSETPEDFKFVPKIIDDKSLGPLSAIVSAYNFKKNDWLFWAIDMPLVSEDMIREIINLNKNLNESIIAYNRDINKFEPYCAFYKKELLAEIISTISIDNYSLQRILTILNVRGDEKLFNKYKENFRSINSYEDLP